MDSSGELRDNDKYFRVINIRMTFKSLEITKEESTEKRLEDPESHREVPQLGAVK